jgi:hypothetical protein
MIVPRAYPEPLPTFVYITVRCPALKDDNGAELSARGLMGTDTPRITGGYGGWNTINRPRKRGSIEYAGINPIEMELEIVFDAWGEDVNITNVDTALAHLERMTIPTGKNLPPPMVYVDSKSVPRPKTTPWVIRNITWGDTIRNSEGETKRQTVQIQFIQADETEYGRLVPKPTKARNPHRNTPRTYLWKKGDTWPIVALRLMGDKKYAITIIRANKFRPGHKMKVGQKIKVPRVPDAK